LFSDKSARATADNVNKSAADYNNISIIFTGSIGAGSMEDRVEWETRATRFDQLVNDVVSVFEKLCTCQNRELVYDLYTYLWDMCSVIMILNGFVHWLARGTCSNKLQSYVVGQQTWFSGIKEAFLSGEHEPWVFRGGLISDLMRLLPLDSGHDLYAYKYPEVPVNLLYNVRPFEPKDEKAVYALATSAYEEDIEAPMGK
jgi:protein O-GlcNAcase/histone acetyltransferase